MAPRLAISDAHPHRNGSARVDLVIQSTAQAVSCRHAPLPELVRRAYPERTRCSMGVG